MRKQQFTGSWFNGCKDLNQLKAEYKRLVMEHHPDLGGDTRTMQDINVAYEWFFNLLKNVQNVQAAQPDSHVHYTTETPEKFRAIIEVLIHLEGLEVELCGSWLWIGGNTKANREALKAAGCSWSPKKGMWYWHHKEDGARWSRGRYSMAEIRATYGSERFRQAKADELAVR